MAELTLAADVTIRPGRLEDLPRLTEIYNHYIVETPITFEVEPYSVEKRRAWFEDFGATGRYRIFVAEQAGNVLGWAHSKRYRDRAAYDTTVETTVYCDKDATGLGLGRQLYTALFESLAGEDVHLAIAGITLPNAASEALHARFGFVSCGVQHEVGRKFGRYWDVGWYEKRLG